MNLKQQVLDIVQLIYKTKINPLQNGEEFEFKITTNFDKICLNILDNLNEKYQNKLFTKLELDNLRLLIKNDTNIIILPNSCLVNLNALGMRILDYKIIIENNVQEILQNLYELIKNNYLQIIKFCNTVKIIVEQNKKNENNKNKNNILNNITNITNILQLDANNKLITNFNDKCFTFLFKLIQKYRQNNKLSKVLDDENKINNILQKIYVTNIIYLPNLVLTELNFLVDDQVKYLNKYTNDDIEQVLNNLYNLININYSKIVGFGDIIKIYLNNR